MAEDGDKVDPARTELTRQRSLDKANDRRVVMTDILDRLRTYSTRWHPEDAVDLVDEAADEIERLREEVRRLRVEAGYD